MKKMISIGLGVISTALMANEVPSGTIKQERQQLFEKHKQLEEQSHQERIKILQAADECVKAAKTPQAYRECEQSEKQSRQQFKQTHQGEIKQLQEERKTLQEKANGGRAFKLKNQQFPRGEIATH